MLKFKFRLQRVLDYRLRLEEKAQQLYEQARSQRLMSENQSRILQESLNESLQAQQGFDLVRARQQRVYAEAVQDRLRQQEIITNTLLEDERKAFARYAQARRDRETIEKLRENAHQEYLRELDLAQQRELDEWAVLRRAA